PRIAQVGTPVFVLRPVVKSAKKERKARELPSTKNRVSRLSVITTSLFYRGNAGNDLLLKRRRSSPRLIVSSSSCLLSHQQAGPVAVARAERADRKPEPPLLKAAFLRRATGLLVLVWLRS